MVGGGVVVVVGGGVSDESMFELDPDAWLDNIKGMSNRVYTPIHLKVPIAGAVWSRLDSCGGSCCSRRRRCLSLFSCCFCFLVCHQELNPVRDGKR